MASRFNVGLAGYLHLPSKPSMGMGAFRAADRMTLRCHRLPGLVRGLALRLADSDRDSQCSADDGEDADEPADPAGFRRPWRRVREHCFRCRRMVCG